MYANLQIQNISKIINLASQKTKLDLTKGLMSTEFYPGNAVYIRESRCSILRLKMLNTSRGKYLRQRKRGVEYVKTFVPFTSKLPFNLTLTTHVKISRVPLKNSM